MTTITEENGFLFIIQKNILKCNILITFFMLCQIHCWSFALWGLYSYLFGVIGTAVVIFVIVLIDNTPIKQSIVLNIHDISIENMGKFIKQKKSISYKNIENISFNEKLIRGGGKVGYIIIKTKENSEFVITVYYEGKIVYQAIKKFILKYVERGINVLENNAEERKK